MAHFLAKIHSKTLSLLWLLALSLLTSFPMPPTWQCHDFSYPNVLRTNPLYLPSHHPYTQFAYIYIWKWTCSQRLQTRLVFFLLLLKSILPPINVDAVFNVTTFTQPSQSSFVITIEYDPLADSHKTRLAFIAPVLAGLPSPFTDKNAVNLVTTSYLQTLPSHSVMVYTGLSRT